MKPMKLFRTPACPACHHVSEVLKKNAIDFIEVDLTTTKGLADLRCIGIFDLQAPVLVVSEKPIIYLDSLQLAKISDEQLIAVITS